MTRVSVNRMDPLPNAIRVPYMNIPMIIFGLQMGFLEVVIPPDVSDEDGGKDHVTNEGGNIRLVCRATGVPEPKVVWRREDGKNIILRHTDVAKDGEC